MEHNYVTPASAGVWLEVDIVEGDGTVEADTAVLFRCSSLYHNSFDDYHLCTVKKEKCRCLPATPRSRSILNTFQHRKQYNTKLNK